MCAGSDVDLVGLQVIQRLSHIAEGLFGGVLKHIVFQNGAGVASHLQALVLFLSGQDVGCGRHLCSQRADGSGQELVLIAHLIQNITHNGGIELLFHQGEHFIVVFPHCHGESLLCRF